MNILVTGAAGFIGRYVTQCITAGGCSVTSVVRSASHIKNLASDTVLNVDLRELGALEAAVKKLPEYVIHLAAVVPSSFDGAVSTKAAEANRKIDEHVFLASKKWGASVIYASSTSIYGAGRSEMRTETSVPRPTGSYADEKVAGEQLGEQLLLHNGLTFMVLRINAPYGPGQRSRNVMNIFIQQAMKGLPISYHGTGNRQQDFTYVVDIADAVVKAISKGTSGTYNISGGHPISMRELGLLVRQCVPNSGSSVVASGEEDSQEGMTAFFSIEKARIQLGWEPRISLETGIRTCIRAFAEEQHENRALI